MLADFETTGHRWVKIADFGISKRIDGTALRTAIGTEDYLAPEVQGFYPADFSEEDERTFSLAVDIWSVGAIAFRMIVGNLPFPSKRKLSDYAMRGQPFPTEESLGLEGTSFIMETMAASPRLRPTSQQALSHPWIVSQGSISGNFGQSHSQRYTSSLQLAAILLIHREGSDTYSFLRRTWALSLIRPNALRQAYY